jgi:hypothetical protein
MGPDRLSQTSEGEVGALSPDTELEAVEQSGGVLLRPLWEQPSMVQVNGLWVLRGTTEPGASRKRALDDVREERIHTVLEA